MTKKFLTILIICLTNFCWEPQSEAWVHNRRIIYITQFHILFHDGSILNRNHDHVPLAYIQADRHHCAHFYTQYRKDQRIKGS